MSPARPTGTVKYDNSGRVVIITGGSGGIGRAIGEAFAASGASVVSLDLNAPEVELEGIWHRRCDVASAKDCQDAVDWTLERFSSIDVLVNNAAIQPLQAYCPIHELSDEVIDRMVAVNFRGYMRMAQLVIPAMLRNRSGVIVNMASGQGHRTAREVGVYGPIKAANLMQTRQWGVEYARQGIRVVSVSPGAIDTPLVRASLAEQGGAVALANRHPLGRIGQPREIASAVLWLTSDEASFITATDLEVDGGLGAFGAFAEPYPLDPTP